MKTTIIHKGKERTWEGPYENWQRHKEYIMGWCDGREVLVHGNDFGCPDFDCNRNVYSFKPEKAEPVVFDGLVEDAAIINERFARVQLLTDHDSVEKLCKSLSGGKSCKITIEEV